MSPFGPWPGNRGNAGVATALLELSFGHGEPDVNDTIPDGDEGGVDWWLSPTTTADIATLSQVREWPIKRPLGHVEIIVVVDRCVLAGGNPVNLEITQNGEATGISVQLDNGASGRFSAGGDYVFTDTDNIGVRAQYGAVTGQLRCEVRLLGDEAEVPTGPLILPSLTVQRETNASTEFPIQTDIGGITVYPNRSTLGATFDYIPNVAPFGQLALETDPDDGLPLVRANGIQSLIQRTLAGGEMAAATPPTFAPFHRFEVVRVFSVTGGGQGFALINQLFAPGAAIGFYVPLLSAFKLVWQYNNDAGTNVDTTPDITALVADKWILLEWQYDGGATPLIFRLNGLTVALGNALNLSTAGVPAADITRSTTNPNSSAPLDIGYRATFMYSRSELGPVLTLSQAARQRAYLLDEYPVSM